MFDHIICFRLIIAGFVLCVTLFAIQDANTITEQYNTIMKQYKTIKMLEETIKKQEETIKERDDTIKKQEETIKEQEETIKKQEETTIKEEIVIDENKQKWDNRLLLVKHKCEQYILENPYMYYYKDTVNECCHNSEAVRTKRRLLLTELLKNELLYLLKNESIIKKYHLQCCEYIHNFEIYGEELKGFKKGFNNLKRLGLLNTPFNGYYLLLMMMNINTHCNSAHFEFIKEMLEGEYLYNTYDDSWHWYCQYNSSIKLGEYIINDKL